MPVTLQNPSGRVDTPGNTEITKVGRGFLALLTLAQTGIFIGFIPLLNLLLPLQAAAIDPANKAVLLGRAALCGGIASAVANIAFGMMSDATQGPMGRRRPWILIGLVLTLFSYGWIYRSSSGVGLVLGIVIFQIGLNAMFGPMNALLPDRVPDCQKGLASSWIGIAQPVATMVTAFVMAILLTTSGPRFAVLAVLVSLLILPIIVLVREPKVSAPMQARRLSLSVLINADFLATFLSRLLVQVAITLNALYLLFYVQGSGELGTRFPDQRPETIFGWLLAAHMTTSLIVGFAGGLLSDRLQKRRIFILFGGLMMAAGLVVMVVLPHWPGPLAGQLIFGSGLGLYATVDIALVAQILPQKENIGRDLGLLNLANSLPQVAAPTLAIALLAVGGASGLKWVFAAGAVFAVAGALTITRVRGVA